MTKLAWFLCINAVAGVVIILAVAVIFLLIMYAKYGEALVDEAIALNTQDSDDYVEFASIGAKTLAYIIGIFLWEFITPYVIYSTHKTIIELYNLRNRP